MLLHVNRQAVTALSVNKLWAGRSLPLSGSDAWGGEGNFGKAYAVL